MSSFGRPLARPHRALRAFLALAALAACLPAWSVYQIKDEKGRVIGYSDKPPATGKATQVDIRGAGGGSGAANLTGLPYDLQQIAGRFPVVLYTRKNCAPCDSGRSFLAQRGIPFSERTADTPGDGAALKRLEGTDQLPVLRIGGQRLDGFSRSEWGGYLDTAGYPAESRLPAGYQQAPATPLSPPAPASAPASSAPREDTPPPSQRGTPGFQF